MRHRPVQPRPVLLGQEMRVLLLLLWKQLLVGCGGAAALGVGMGSLKQRRGRATTTVVPVHQVTTQAVNVSVPLNNLLYYDI